MDGLPMNILLKILDLLHTKDAIRCRAVCQTWHTLIDQFVLDELNLFADQMQYSEYFEYRKCRSNLNKSISLSNDNNLLGRIVIKNEKFYHLFRNVKKFFFVQEGQKNDDSEHDLEMFISM